MEQRNIVLVSGSGVYGAVSKYITEFAAAFRELGYHTVILDGNLKSFRDKYRYLKEHISIYALVDCQAMVAECTSGMLRGFFSSTGALSVRSSAVPVRTA